VPGFKRAQLTPGPLSDLVDALHQLHLAAGYPSTRQLQRDIGGAGVTSHTSIHKLFTGTTVPSWGAVELLVEAMARRARLDEKTEVERFRRLWAQAARPGSAASTSEATAPARAETNGPDIRERQREETLSRPIAHLLPEVLDEIEAIGARSATGTFRVPTGFDDLDSLLGGWSQGCLIVIGGRPSSGKTTLLLNFCQTASIKYQLPSMLISGEMNSRELQSRLLSAEARVPLHRMRTGQMGEEDWSRLARVMAVMASAPIRIGTPTEFRIE
jgi:replicative DNA helicase